VIRAATLILAILVVAAVADCVYYYRIELGLVKPQTPSETYVAPSTGAESRSSQTVWQTVDRSADGFRVEMPADVTESHAPAYTTLGVARRVEMLQASPSPGETFAISWDDNPPVRQAARQDAGHTLDLALNGALARTQTVLITQSRSTYAGYDSRDFIARGDGGIMQARLVMAGSRLFLLIASFPSQGPQHDTDVGRFFNSLAVSGTSGQ
jgi:hypothetical protein